MDSFVNCRKVMDAERLFYTSLNYQRLLNVTKEAADVIASESIANREHAEAQFENRLRNVIAVLEKSPDHRFESSIHNMSLLNNMTNKCETNYAFAAFHFDMHRNLILDLVFAGYKVVAPIAGDMFQKFLLAAEEAGSPYAKNLKLIDVNSKKVGRELIKHIRDGYIPLFYVDGNMGPDGFKVQEGAEVISFCGANIKVKSGIRRITEKLGLSVIPVFTHKHQSSSYSISLSETISPSSSLMQSLYRALESRVTEAPNYWEFATCFHRWVVPTKKIEICLETINSKNQFFVNRKLARLTTLKGKQFLINTKTYKALEIPSSMSSKIEKIIADGQVSLKTSSDKSNLLREQIIVPLIKTGFITP